MTTWFVERAPREFRDRTLPFPGTPKAHFETPATPPTPPVLKSTGKKPADFAPVQDAPSPAEKKVTLPPPKKAVPAVRFVPDAAPPPAPATPKTPRTPRGTPTEVKFPNTKGTEFEGCGEAEGLEVWRVRGRKRAAVCLSSEGPRRATRNECLKAVGLPSTRVEE